MLSEMEVAPPEAIPGLDNTTISQTAPTPRAPLQW